MRVHKWRDVSAHVRERPGAAERIERAKEEARSEMALHELRRAREFTQAQLARALGVSQSGVSRIENETDLYVSTLRSYVEALGGRLEIRAVFEASAVTIADFASTPPLISADAPPATPPADFLTRLGEDIRAAETDDPIAAGKAGST